MKLIIPAKVSWIVFERESLATKFNNGLVVSVAEWSICKQILMFTFTAWLIILPCHTALAFQKDGNENASSLSSPQTELLKFVPGEVIVKLKEKADTKSLLAQTYSGRIAEHTTLFTKLKK